MGNPSGQLLRPDWVFFFSPIEIFFFGLFSWAGRYFIYNLSSLHDLLILKLSGKQAKGHYWMAESCRKIDKIHLLSAVVGDSIELAVPEFELRAPL